MPRESPPKGQSHTVFAAKSSGGWRTEISGVVSHRKVKLIMALLNLPDEAVDPFAKALGIPVEEAEEASK